MLSEYSSIIQQKT